MDAKSNQNKNIEKSNKDAKDEPTSPNKGNEESGQNKGRGGHNRGGRGGGRGRGGNPNNPGRGRGGRGGGMGGGMGGQNRQMQEQAGFMSWDSYNSMGFEDPSLGEQKEKRKFTGRCRLFVGNLTPETSEEQFKEMFKPYGEVGEVFVNGAKGFGFIRLDYRHNAEAAKTALDGTLVNGRMLRIRYANHGAALKVKNLSPYVSNELLEQTFSQFGEVERAVVITDDRGRSLYEGIVEFARKPAIQQCMRRINEGVLLMSSYPRPVSVEVIEPRDEEDGLAEKYVPRNEAVRRDREKEPRFAPIGSFEYRFAQKYREIDELEKQKIERIKQEMEQQRINLESEMEGAIYEYQAEQIRADLMRQQEELRRLEEMKTEQMRRRQEMEARREEEMRMLREDEDRRREMLMRGGGGRGMEGLGMGEGSRGNNSSLPPPPAPPAALGFDSPQEGFGGGSSREGEDSMGMFEGGKGGFGGAPGSYPNRNQGGMFGNRRFGDVGMDRRRQGPGGNDEFEMKRMRRF